MKISSGALVIFIGLSSTTSYAFHTQLSSHILRQRNHARIRPQQQPSPITATLSAESYPDHHHDYSSTTTSISTTTDNTIMMNLNDSDVDQQVIEKKLQARSTIPQIYRIQLPLQQLDGITFVSIDTGRNVLDRELDLGTLTIQQPSSATTTGTVSRIDPALLRQLDTSFRGIVVSKVKPNSIAWNYGIRSGHVLRSVSATLGSNWWPKSTLEGLRSAIVARRHQKDVMTIGMEFEILAETNVFELTLKKPLGFQIQETNDGYVQISSIQENASNLVKHALRVGDRIVAMDSSLGDKLWPVSTVEGVISSVTGRIPGQSVTLRFERPPGTPDVIEPVMRSSLSLSVTTPTTTSSTTKESTQVTEISPSHKELIERCREVLQRYTATTSTTPTTTSASNKDEKLFRSKLDTVPALVADKVVEKLSTASVAMDSKTLSMLMHAYLTCQQPQKAIQLFEWSTGYKADASTIPLERKEESHTLQPNDAALTLYTGTMLLQAHAQNKDLNSVQRVLAALEGRSGEIMGGREVAPWPWTGTYGSIQPDTFCHNVALAAADQVGGSNAVSFATDLFSRIMKPDIVTYNTFLNILVNNGKFEESFRLFDQMKRLKKIRPDKYTYYALMKSCKNNTDLQELVYDMKENNIPIDVVFYNAMIQNLSENREWSQATRLIQEMESKGVAPQAMTYGILMNGMLRADKPNACLALFESACANSKTVGLTQNVHLYTTAIAAAAVLGNHERALELVSRMTAVGIKPNTKTLTSVVGACLASQKYDLASGVYRKIEKPDGYAMAQGIQAFCGNGEIEAAASIVRQQQQRGTHVMSGKLMMRSYRHIIQASLENHKYELAREMLSNLLQKGYIPSKEITDMIVNIFGIYRSSVVEPTEADHSRFRFLLFVMDVLEQRNLPVDGTLYAAALTLGRQMGGVERRVANLLLQSKSNHSDTPNVVLLDSNGSQSSSSTGKMTWEEILLRYNEIKHAVVGNMLPTLRIRVNARNTRQVFRAEQGVAYNRSKSNNSQSADK